MALVCIDALLYDRHATTGKPSWLYHRTWSHLTGGHPSCLELQFSACKSVYTGRLDQRRISAGRPNRVKLAPGTSAAKKLAGVPGPYYYVSNTILICF